MINEKFLEIMNGRKNNTKKTMDSTICEQVPPEIRKAHSFRFGMYIFYISAILFLLGKEGGLVILSLILGLLLQRFSKRYKERSRIYIRTLNLLEKSTFINIDNISNSLNKSNKEINTELNDMINKNYFKQGHIYDNIFFLDNETYNIYIDTKESYSSNYKDNQVSNKNLLENSILVIEKNIETIEDTEIKDLYSKINKNLTRLLFEMEENLDLKLNANIEHYYLPSTIKMIENYKYLEIHGKEEEIEKIKIALYNLNDLFKQNLNDINSYKIKDINADLDILNDMLNQEKIEKTIKG